MNSRPAPHLSDSEYSLRFLLGRLIHDLSNSVAGILSLSDHHLRAGVSEPALQESLQLVYDSSEGARQLLIAVGQLMHPASFEEELVRPSGLMDELERLFRLLTPRSVELKFSCDDGDHAIRVVRADFVRRFFTLLSLNLGEDRVTLGAIAIGCRVGPETATFSYESDIGAATEVEGRVLALFAPVVSSGQQLSCAASESELIFSLWLPLEQIAMETEGRPEAGIEKLGR